MTDIESRFTGLDNIHCYRRPNRKHPRIFTSRDVARIAKYAADGGATPIELIAGVVVVLGLGYTLCRAANYMRNLLSFKSLIIEIGGTLAMAALIDGAITVLSRGIWMKLHWTRLAALALIATLIVFKDAVNGIIELFKDSDDINDIVVFVDQLCKLVKLKGE